VCWFIEHIRTAIHSLLRLTAPFKNAGIQVCTHHRILIGIRDLRRAHEIVHPNPDGVDSAAKKRSKNFPRHFSRNEIAN
jgi:hypothetical protein